MSAAGAPCRKGAFSHTLQFSGLVLMNRRAKFLCSLAIYLVEPVEVYQAKTITKCKTRGGLEDFAINAARGEHLQVLGEVMQRCSQLLHGMPALANFAGQGESAMVVERHFAKTALNLTLAIVGNIHTSRTMYSHGFPFTMMRLLSHDESERTRCLQFCESTWRALRTLGDRMAVSGDAFFASLHAQLVWPSQHFCREMLLQLASCDFSGVPLQEVANPLLRMARGFGGTKIIEDLVHVAKTVNASNEAGKGGVMEVMHELSNCKVLEEYDRPRPTMVKLSPFGRAQIGAQLKQCSECKVSACNIKEEEFVQFGGAEYQAVSPEAYRMQGVATMSLLEVAEDLHRARKHWMNLMLYRGALLQKMGTPNAYLVSSVSEHGVIAVRIFPVKDQTPGGHPFNWFSLCPLPGIHDDNRMRVVFLQVTHLRTWRAADIEPCLGPSLRGRVADDSVAARSDLVLRFVGGRPLVEWSALRAFRGISTARRFGGDSFRLQFPGALLGGLVTWHLAF